MKKVHSLLLPMILDEKVGIMNRYNCFSDVTDPVRAGGISEKSMKVY